MTKKTPSNIIPFPSENRAERRQAKKSAPEMPQSSSKLQETMLAYEIHSDAVRSCGLCPEDIPVLMNLEYEASSPYFTADFQDTKLIRQTPLFIECIDLLLIAQREGGLQLTTTGNLKRAVCRELWEKHYKTEYFPDPPSSENDVYQISRSKVLLLESGCLQYRNNSKLEISEEGLAALDARENNQAAREFYSLWVDILMNDWDWLNGTRFREYEDFQDSGLLSLYIIHKHAQRWTQAQKLGKTISRILDPEFHAQKNNGPEDPFASWDILNSMFTYLFLERVAKFCGWIEDRNEQLSPFRDFECRASKLFKNSFEFHGTLRDRRP